MFTGIVQGVHRITSVSKQVGLTQYAVEVPARVVDGLKVGASVAIDGVCQTVVRTIQCEQKDRKAGESSYEVFFDAIQETLSRTTLGSLEVGRWVNVERAARIGDEIGGHLTSGHVVGVVKLVQMDVFENYRIAQFQGQPEWVRFLFPKGFVALDGVSLTLVDVHPEGSFTVHLIPETLRMSSFGKKEVGANVNLELDLQTQATVETVERVLGRWIEKRFVHAI